MMPALTALLPLVMLLPGSWMTLDHGPAQAKQVFPKKAGIYAMTAHGRVELKISGERSDVPIAPGLKVKYSPGDVERIPVADTVQSFYVSALGWEPKDLYMVVGRERLTDPMSKYQRLTARVVTRGIVAFEVISVDLEPGFLLHTIRGLAPRGAADEGIEAYLVLELKSTSGLGDRCYPVRITVPKQ